MKEITVETQSGLDAIPADFSGQIYIEFGTHYHPAVVKKRYKYPVVARGKIHAFATKNSFVEVRDTSQIVARDDSLVYAYAHSTIEASGDSTIKAYHNSAIKACDHAQIVDFRADGKTKSVEKNPVMEKAENPYTDDRLKDLGNFSNDLTQSQNTKNKPSESSSSLDNKKQELYGLIKETAESYTENPEKLAELFEFGSRFYNLQY